MVWSDDHLCWRERLARKEAMSVVDAAAQVAPARWGVPTSSRPSSGEPTGGSWAKVSSAAAWIAPFSSAG
jgi:hypothetical protein